MCVCVYKEFPYCLPWGKQKQVQVWVLFKADSRFGKCFPNIDTFRQGGPYQILPFNL